MKVEHKSYAQILIVNRSDFIFSLTYREYEEACPFLCFPKMFAADFRTSVKQPEQIAKDKDVILLLEEYWDLLTTEEKKAILDHELGHISNGDLRATEERIKRGDMNNTVSLDKEKAADAYSADINGKTAMYHGLMKALEVIVQGVNKKGYRVTIDQVIANDAILKKRFEILKEGMKENK